MKASRYNYFVDNGEKTIVFNGITEKFFEINSSNAPIYKQIFSHPGQFGKDVIPFIEKTKNDGFFVNDETDEFELVKNKLKGQTKENQYFLMVLPTYQCNLRCWYCIQNHKEIWITEDVIRKIKKRIMLKMNDDSIDSLCLSWFGGEPLMAYETVVGLTRFAKETAESCGKAFNCTITTNSTLLTPERIEELKECGVDSYQITIDGTREYHNTVKVINGKSTFDMALQNIDAIARHSRCLLRFNYTKENLRPEGIINDIKGILSEESKKNISFFLYKVWQENAEDINNKDVAYLFEEGKKLGIHPALPRTSICYADQKHFDCIFPDGRVEKCDNEDPDAARGVLLDDGNIDWPGGVPVSHTTAYKAGDSECIQCRFLPLCGGPCVAKRNRMYDSFGKVVCQYGSGTRKIAKMEETVNNIVKNQSVASLLKVV